MKDISNNQSYFVQEAGLKAGQGKGAAKGNQGGYTAQTGMEVSESLSPGGGGQKIYCSVDSCHYWSQGNRCEANEIIVMSDAAAANLPDSVDAPKHNTVQPTPTKNCMETCCKTFVSNGSDQKKADGVHPINV